MNWVKQGTISRRFPAGVLAWGPFNLPVNMNYTGIDITVNEAEVNPITCEIDIDISFDAGATYEPFLRYTWNFTGTPGRGGVIARNFSCAWDLPEIYRGTKVQGVITMSRAARFTIDFNSGSGEV